MDDRLYDITINTRGPHSIKIRVESDDQDVEQWAEFIQDVIEENKFMQIHCISTDQWYVFKGKDIISFVIKQLSRAKILEVMNNLENIRWPVI